MLDIKHSSKYKFKEDKLWFTVQALNERYLICTSETKLGHFHTIVDLEKSIRGDDAAELCEQRLQEFIVGDLKISHRNWGAVKHCQV